MKTLLLGLALLSSLPGYGQADSSSSFPDRWGYGLAAGASSKGFRFGFSVLYPYKPRLQFTLTARVSSLIDNTAPPGYASLLFNSKARNSFYTVSVNAVTPIRKAPKNRLSLEVGPSAFIYIYNTFHSSGGLISFVQLEEHPVWAPGLNTRLLLHTSRPKAPTQGFLSVYGNLNTLYPYVGAELELVFFGREKRRWFRFNNWF